KKTQGSNRSRGKNPISPCHYRLQHCCCIDECRRDYNQSQHRNIRAAGEAAQRRTQRISRKIASRSSDEDTDIVVGAGLDAVQTERAIHVPGFPGKEELKLAAAVNGIAAQTIVRRAGGTGFRPADSYLQRRYQRADEVELPDRADILTK